MIIVCQISQDEPEVFGELAGAREFKQGVQVGPGKHKQGEHDTA